MLGPDKRGFAEGPGYVQSDPKGMFVHRPEVTSEGCVAAGTIPQRTPQSQSARMTTKVLKRPCLMCFLSA